MLVRQFAVYVLVGVLTLAVDVGTMQALLWMRWPDYLAVSGGFMVGFGFNFLSQQRLTFKASHSHLALIRYTCVVLLNYLLTLGCVWYIQYLGGPVIWGKLVSLPVVTATGFILGRYWIFRH